MAGPARGPPTAAHTAPLKLPPRAADADGFSELVEGAVDVVVACPELLRGPGVWGGLGPARHLGRRWSAQDFVGAGYGCW